ncbi:MAG: HAD-IIA family hydrolase [Anaerolineaceae bacterium]
MTGDLSQIQLFLLDMDGTFNLGEKLIPGSLDFIAALGRQKRDYVFVTNNSSRNRGQYAEKITRLGLPTESEKIFTSGEAACLYLQKEFPGAAVYPVGTLALEAELTRHDIRVELESPDLVLLGFDTGFTYNKLWRLCDLVRAGLPYIATHPDFNCPVEGGFMPDIGAVIAFVQASTGRRPDEIIGKPNRLMAEMLSEKLDLPLSDMAMVGDRLYTDIALGESAGITTCLVLSGETSRNEVPDSLFQPDYIFENLGELGKWLEDQVVKKR